MSYGDLGNNLRIGARAGTSAGTQMVNSPLGITATKTGDDVTYYTRDSNGTILNAHGAGGTRNYFSEFNGSVTALYNSAGVEVGSYTYSPYGKTNPTGTTAASNPFRYIGGYQDKTDTGNDRDYKLGARYYDTRGHFTQPDPIIPGGGTFTYAEGDPINSSDPSGNCSQYDLSGLCQLGNAVGSFTGRVASALNAGVPYLSSCATGAGYAAASVGVAAKLGVAVGGPYAYTAFGALCVGGIGFRALTGQGVPGVPRM